jgi:transcriptional regulator with XRE-family HTH domain
MRSPKAVARALRTLGQNMRRLRLALNLSQTEVAQRAGLFWRHWQKIETGTSNCCVSSVVGIAAALDVDIAALFAPPPL